MTEFITGDNGNKPSQLRDFRSAVLEFEETLIRNALTRAGNKPTVAARLLGLSNHQSLLAMLDNRHKNLRDELNLTKRPRRKTLMKP